MSSPLEQRLKTALAQRQLRLTSARLAVFRLLVAQPTPIKLARLAAALPSVDRASVYRTLKLFVDLGIVERLPAGFKHAYELAAPYQAHHHHLSCDQCGRVISFDSGRLEQLLERIASQHGLHLHSHSLELVGCCQQCKDH